MLHIFAQDLTLFTLHSAHLVYVTNSFCNPFMLLSLHLWLVLLCEYSKFRIESNSYFSIRLDLKRAQLFEIFTVTYLTEWRRFFTLATMPSNRQNQQTAGHRVVCWPIMAHQVLKHLQQKQQQCGAIKTVEFI